MRTTLDLDPIVLAAARAIAHEERVSLGTAVSRLAARGLRARSISERVSGFPVFEVPADAPAITLDVVNDHRD